MDAVESVFGGSGLKHRVAVYVPSTTNVNVRLDERTALEWENSALTLLSTLFGGATAMPVRGGWVTNEGTLVTENVTIVYAFVNDLTTDSLLKVREFVLRMKVALGQEAVAVEIDGQLLFV